MVGGAKKKKKKKKPVTTLILNPTYDRKLETFIFGLNDGKGLTYMYMYNFGLWR